MPTPREIDFARVRLAEVRHIIKCLQTREKKILAYLTLHAPGLIEMPTSTKKDAVTYSPEFERIWAIYPARNGIKVEKQSAAKRFERIPRAKWPQVETAIKNYGKSADVKRGAVRDMVRFLKDEFWPVWIKPTEAMLQAARDAKGDKRTSAQSAVEEVINGRN